MKQKINLAEMERKANSQAYFSSSEVWVMLDYIRSLRSQNDALCKKVSYLRKRRDNHGKPKQKDPAQETD